ncbi:hypothetical protein TYRP_003874 [Tyrophagus putrescentiae]|nr:hypothetical protein TYRP_003874 [Tyrophagus putrescentiae]
MALLLRVIFIGRSSGPRNHHNHHNHHHYHHPRRSLLALLLITTLIVLSLAPSIECIFKMYAAHKGGPTQHKGPPDYYGGMGGMGMGMPAYGGGGFDAHMPYLPKKRSFRVGKPSSSLSSRFTLRRRSTLLQHHQQQQLYQHQRPRSLGGRSSRRGRVKKSSRSQAPHFSSPSASQIAALSPSPSSSSTIKFPVYIRKSSSSSSSPSASGS